MHSCLTVHAAFYMKMHTEFSILLDKSKIRCNQIKRLPKKCFFIIILCAKTVDLTGMVCCNCLAVLIIRI